MRGDRGGAARIRDEGSVMELDRRGCVVQPRPWANRQPEEPVDEAKPFNIPKRVVWKAFKRVLKLALDHEQGNAGSTIPSPTRLSLVSIWSARPSTMWSPGLRRRR